MYLKKDPGNPFIDKLHMLHLFEADYNFFSSGIHLWDSCPKWKWQDASMTVKVGAGWDVAPSKRLYCTTTFCITRTLAANLSKDVAKCFDCLIEAFTNLICRPQRANT